MKTTIFITGFGILTAAFLSLSNLNVFEPTQSSDSGMQQTIDTESFAFGHNYQIPLEEITYSGSNEVYKVEKDNKLNPADPLLHNPAELEHIYLNSIEYIEEAETVNLGFDVEAYLPADFNPYAGMMENPYDVLYLVIEEPIELGFETSEYLPAGFDPYSNKVLSIDDINYMETEEVVDLGFDVNEYLLAGFNPYARVTPDKDRINLDDIIYIEDEEPIEINTGLNQSMTIFFYPN